MQNAKDTFYLTLRDALKTINPARQVTLGGVLRPGILVEENETVTEQMPMDVFVLRWAGASRNVNLPATLESDQCEIVYASEGSAGNELMDRGRALTEMDAELALMLADGSAQKLSVGSAATVPMQTNIFWDNATFGAVERVGAKLQRTVTVNVFALQEILQGGQEER